jgi:predicted metal-dependent peptidase
MKRFITGLVCALAIALVASFGVAAKDKTKKKTVEFAQDVMVNGTLLKAGTYDVKFNEETGELNIIKNGKVKATTTAHLEQRSNEAKDTAVLLVNTGGAVAEFKGLALGGSNQNVIVSGSGGASSAQ